MPRPYAVVFAGVPGVSKTPIAHYLSCEFGLPIFNTDQIRYEVREDLRLDDINKPGGIEEYEKRQLERYRKLLASGEPFIFNGSMDRKWGERKPDLINAGYAWFMINMELSKSFLVRLFNETGRAEWAQDQLDHYLEQHADFIAAFSTDIHVEIKDENFAHRFELAADGLESFLQKREVE